MLIIECFIGLLSMLFSLIACFINYFILFSIFYFKRIPVNPNMILIYSRFGIDVIYTYSSFMVVTYILIMTLSTNLRIKNLIFLFVWTTTSIKTMRSILAFLITIERVIATYFPVLFYKYRCKTSTIMIYTSILICGLINQYVLFGYCGNVIDTPLQCSSFFCAINSCYYYYWLTYEEVVSFLNGIFSVALLFRFFIWNFLSKTPSSNHKIARATRIALLDFFIILFFNVIPSYTFAHSTTVNVKTIGSLSLAIKTFGFVIEGMLTCRVLFGAKKVSANVVAPNS
ncbi:Serpentine Receptor, class BC (Class B-like) [Caenorhabditis elegans]|uniref:Serpentine Receptor, class BC (Class B-like) n=1 Tax=Caenorhabditis elegans TaxID=6239 RepID=Q9XXK0_CAEEL|nr:Serpentine Receptor, class BC (Class B-like) [Caenorhabditis elegans]CAA19430.3 Serpentine Receptor, class BC (Class B-like) [Caenorhabditis elegans]|eukprot:NP_001343563.1 Serpentine Receptor, class BC (class B-like) [Caenorhabditis elegans]